MTSPVVVLGETTLVYGFGCNSGTSSVFDDGLTGTSTIVPPVSSRTFVYPGQSGLWSLIENRRRLSEPVYVQWKSVTSIVLPSVIPVLTAGSQEPFPVSSRLTTVGPLVISDVHSSPLAFRLRSNATSKLSISCTSALKYGLMLMHLYPTPTW